MRSGKRRLLCQLANLRNRLLEIVNLCSYTYRLRLRRLAKMDRPTNYQAGLISLTSEFPIDWSSVINLSASILATPDTQQHEMSGILEFLLFGEDDLKLLDLVAKKIHDKFSIDVKCEVIEL